jgi:hypothetical protein
MAQGGGIKLTGSELGNVRERSANAHQHLVAAIRTMLRLMNKPDDLSGLMLDLHVHLDKNVFALAPDEDDFIVIRNDLRPVGVYIDPRVSAIRSAEEALAFPHSPSRHGKRSWRW